MKAQNLATVTLYTFKDADLLRQALTHRSTENTPYNYERLEFLGDRVLNLVVAHMLLREFPNDKEGFLAERHAQIVRKETLADIGRDCHLFHHIICSKHLKDLKNNNNILADVMESIIGALYCDGGLKPVYTFVEKHFSPYFLRVKTPKRDPKSLLQEWAQKNALKIPQYVLIEKKGEDHDPTFIVNVKVAAFDPALGKGKSIQLASQDAARTFIKTHNTQ